MFQSKARIRLATLVGAGAGAVIAVPAILWATMSGGAGHGSYSAARLLFPFSMLVADLGGSIGLLAAGVGLLQFPSYGALVARAAVLKDYRIAFYAAAAHLVASFACFSGMLHAYS